MPMVAVCLAGWMKWGAAGCVVLCVYMQRSRISISECVELEWRQRQRIKIIMGVMGQPGKGEIH